MHLILFFYPLILVMYILLVQLLRWFSVWVLRYCIDILFQDSRRNAEPETYVPSEEPGSTTTSSTSSSVNPAGAKDHSPLFPSPVLASDQKMAQKVHHHANVGETTKNLPPLPKSKLNATKKGDNNRYRPGLVFRSASTREFRNIRREEYLLFDIDN